MTKEVILKDILKHGGMCAYYDGDVYDGEAGSLHEGMDIYAKQQSIEFKKFVSLYHNGEIDGTFHNENISDEELYYLFLQSQNNTDDVAIAFPIDENMR